MANIKSQIKRNRQNAKATDRNKAVKSEFKTAIRKFREAADAGDKAQAETLMRDASKLVDKAASKGVIHANQAANKKSRMAVSPGQGRLDPPPALAGTEKGAAHPAALFSAPEWGRVSRSSVLAAGATHGDQHPLEGVLGVDRSGLDVGVGHRNSLDRRCKPRLRPVASQRPDVFHLPGGSSGHCRDRVGRRPARRRGDQGQLPERPPERRGDQHGRDAGLTRVPQQPQSLSRPACNHLVGDVEALHLDPAAVVAPHGLLVEPTAGSVVADQLGAGTGEVAQLGTDRIDQDLDGRWVGVAAEAGELRP